MAPVQNAPKIDNNWSLPAHMYGLVISTWNTYKGLEGSVSLRRAVVLRFPAVMIATFRHARPSLSSDVRWMMVHLLCSYNNLLADNCKTAACSFSTGAIALDAHVRLTDLLCWSCAADTARCGLRIIGFESTIMVCCLAHGYLIHE